ncbi:MerR family transcriptional regulator [Leisingera caerulea]|uniref:MerR family transcriptional regulator n=1 Tax=Leisingera caerulea TaxID=506591 RepID=UPI00040E8739|nr:MerR family transcriptional regulator [Leisingera caerulea]
MSKSPDAFRTISEVADWLGVQAHVLRFWESKFTQVKPVKRAGGRRYYRPADMRLLGGIRKLLHDDGMSIKDVQALLREHGAGHVAEFSHPVDGAPADRPAAVPPADKLGDNWQSSLELSHEQAAEEDAGSDASNVVGFPQQAATADDILQEPAGAPAAVDPAASGSAPDSPADGILDAAPDDAAEPAAAAEPDSPAGPAAAAPEPQMRMDLAPPAAETGTEHETGADTDQPAPSAPAAQQPPADSIAPAATEDFSAPAVETEAASPWSGGAAEAAEDAPEETRPAEIAPDDGGQAAPPEPAPDSGSVPLEQPAAAADEAVQEAAPEPHEDFQPPAAGAGFDEVSAQDAAAPAPEQEQPDARDVSDAEPETTPEQEFPAAPASAAVPPPAHDMPDSTEPADVSDWTAQAPAAADTAEPDPQAAPEDLTEPAPFDQPEHAAAPEPSAGSEPAEALDTVEEHRAAEEAAWATEAAPFAAPGTGAEPEPAQDTLVAAAGLQPEEPLDFGGSGAEPFAASLPETEADPDPAADPAAAFPPHDLDEAARQVDALEFGSGFDPEADAAPETDQPQDSLEAAQPPGQAPEQAPAPEDAAAVETAADAPAPVLPQPGVLAHLAAIRSLPPQSVAGIAACADELRSLVAKDAAAGTTLENGTASGPEIT